MIMILASELLMPGWFGLWVKNLLEYRAYTRPPLFPFVMGRTGEVLGILLVAATAYWGWRFRRVDPGDEFMMIVSLFLAVTITMFPSADAVYEDLLLWPGLVWIYIHREEFFRTQGPKKWSLYVAIGAFLWFYLAACVLLAWVAFGMPWNRSIMLIAIHPTASLPFIVVGLLTLSLLGRVRSVRLQVQ
jgi:hypothetical protein